ncbi:MAG: GFA family protein [Gammaproteobacteria bacterium]|nr:GFA family protein [Gammaproteobacteria bacterium]
MYTCSGGCHCGRVKFEIEIPDKIIVHRCNCSICRKSGYLHLIVVANRFKLLCGEERLVDYRFHTGVARHLFCDHCGIKSFYVPRSHPESFSVNLNCVDLPDEIDVTIEAFDGCNWSKNRERLVKAVTDETQSG